MVGQTVVDLEPYLIVLGLIAGYAAAVLYLRASGRTGPERTLSLFGPALMIKTRRGRGLLDRLGSYRRFWSVAGDVAIALMALAMIVVVGLLALEAVLISQVPASEAPSPQTALGIPGINPIIPVGYGLLALIVGVVIHEVFHGIVARSQKIGVKSLGILWLVIPIGAFVEQEEADMTSASRRRRDRVVGAGVLANFLVAALCFGVCSTVLVGSVAANATGVGIAGVLPDYPAANASLAAGDIVTAVNGTSTPNNVALENALALTRPGESIAVSFVPPGATATRTIDVTLAPAEEYSHVSADAHKGFLGISVTGLTPGQLSGVLSAPWQVSGGPVVGLAIWTILPLLELQPVQGTYLSYYHATGPLAGLGVGGLFTIVNVFYWLSWMNLLLGLSNSLPIYPFDGGLLFRDFSGGVISRLRSGWDAARRERAAGEVALAASFLLVFLLAWLFIGPHL